MSRKLPSFIPGNYYHIYNRGAHCLSIFREPDNYLFVLRLLRQYLRDLDLTIIVYCLMPNHYHFLVRQNGERPAGKLPQLIFNSYSKAYNKRYNHSGTLFEGPYDARHVQTQAHLRHLCRYIHANPVKDGLVAQIEEWPYSNYLEFVGQRPGKLIEMDFVNAYFPDRQEYVEFVREYLIQRKLVAELAYLE
jgi:putative transposase